MLLWDPRTQVRRLELGRRRIGMVRPSAAAKMVGDDACAAALRRYMSKEGSWYDIDRLASRAGVDAAWIRSKTRFLETRGFHLDNMTLGARRKTNIVLLANGQDASSAGFASDEDEAREEDAADSGRAEAAASNVGPQLAPRSPRPLRAPQKPGPRRPRRARPHQRRASSNFRLQEENSRAEPFDIVTKSHVKSKSTPSAQPRVLVMPRPSGHPGGTPRPLWKRPAAPNPPLHTSVTDGVIFSCQQPLLDAQSRLLPWTKWFFAPERPSRVHVFGAS
jgi:hypothetical protein